MTAKTRARFEGPPAVDGKGNAIPHTIRWGYSSDVYLNSTIYSFLFMAFVMGSFIKFNTSPYAYQVYDQLHQKYTPFQINTWGTFLISTIIYYLVAGLFAFVDLSGHPRFLFKYKVQPFQRVNATEYWEITKIVIRNQIVVVLPLVFIKAHLTPNEIDPKYLPGPWKTLGHLLFNVVSQREINKKKGDRGDPSYSMISID